MPFAGRPSAAADSGASVGSGARQQFLRIARPHDLHRAIAGALGKRCVERHQLAVKLEGVAIERGEQRRVRQLEIGLIERDLRGIDRPRQDDALLDHLLPGGGAERLVLPERREFHRDRPADKAAVDVAFEAAVERGESELPSIRALRAQVEAGGAQPCRHDVLGAMAGLEDAQRLRLELAALVLRHGEIVILNLPQAFAPEPGRADIAPRRLRPIARAQRGIDRRIDRDGDARWSARASYWQPDPWFRSIMGAPQNGMSSLSAWRCMDA